MLIVKNKVLNPIDIEVNRIINDGMNKLKEILKEGWDVYPKWLWALNGFVIAMAFIIILFV
jgi:hypothetical protein